MKFYFNDNIEIIYGLDYCINREKGDLKQYNTKEKNKYIEEFYQIYLDNISQVTKKEIIKLGQYHNKAEYVLKNKDLSFINISIFKDWLKKVKKLQTKIIADIKKDKYLDNFSLDSLKAFYNMDLGEVNIIFSLFISGGFGIFINNSYAILGVKYSTKRNIYKVTGNLIAKIYHEVSHPYVHQILQNKKINNLLENLKVDKSYQNNYIEELVVRIIEIIFASKIYKEDYINWALNEQDKQGFAPIRKYIDIFLSNEDKIKNINDLIELINKEN